MKRVAVALVVIVIAVLALSACNHSTCPAYSDTNTQQVENNS